MGPARSLALLLALGGPAAGGDTRPEPSDVAPTAAPSPELEAPAPVKPYEDPISAAMKPASGGLTADEVAERAVANSYDIRAREAQLRAAAASLDQTMIQFLPQVKGTATYTRLSPTEVAFGSGAIVGAQVPGLVVAAPCDPALGVPAIAQCLYDQEMNLVGAAETNFDNPLNQYSLQASLAVPLSDYALSLSPARKGSLAQMESAQKRRDAERLRVENDARVAYYNWLKSVAQVSASQQTLEHTRARHREAEGLYEAGVLNKADLMRLEALVESMEAMAAQSREFRDLAARQLDMIMGGSGATTPNYAVGEDLSGPAPSNPGDRPLDALIEEAWSQRLELQAIRANIDGVSFGIKASRANYFPRVDGFAEFTYANPNQRFFPLSARWRGSWSAGVSLSWVMNQALFTKAQIASYRASEADMEAQYQAAKRGIAMEVSAAYAELRRAEAIASHQARAVAAAEEAYRVAVDLFRAGEVTTTDIIDAEAERVNTSLQGVNAQIDLRVASAKLRYATGRETTTSPSR